MPQLEPIQTAASANSRGEPRSTSSRDSSTSRSPFNHTVSGRHLDDHSLYHPHNDVSDKEEGEWVENESDYSEQVAKNENEKAEGTGLEETSEVRGGILTERDLEAPPLERKQTSRSVKDPSLVRSCICPYMCRKSDWHVGHLERSGRPGKSQELVSKAEMGGYDRCVIIHLHFASLILNGRPSYFSHFHRVRNQK